MYASGVCMHACMQKQAMHACVRPCTEQNGMSFMRMSTQVYVYCMFACGCLWRKTYISTYAYDRRYLWEHPYAHVHIGIFINVPVCVHIGLPPSPLFRALSWIDGSEPGPLPNFCCHALSVTVFSCGRLDSVGGRGDTSSSFCTCLQTPAGTRIELHSPAWIKINTLKLGFNPPLTDTNRHIVQPPLYVQGLVRHGHLHGRRQRDS